MSPHTIADVSNAARATREHAEQRRDHILVENLWQL